MVVDDLNLIRVTRTKCEAYSELVVDPNAPLPGVVSLEFLQPIARWHAQECDLGSCINKQQLASGPPRERRRDNPIPLTNK